MKLLEETINSETKFHGRIIDLETDTVRLENGQEAGREIVRHPGGVVMLALTEDQQVFVVRQFRYPYKEVLTELPAGKLEKGEDPVEAAKRELREEVGVQALHLEDMGLLYPSPGYLDEIIHLYLATDFTMTEQQLDEDEFLEVERIPFMELVQQVLNNQIRDAKTQTLVLKTYFKLAESAK